MFRSSFRATLVVLATFTLVLGGASVASAASFSDIDAGLLGQYGLAADEIGQVSSGYPDGSWRPWQDITRGQFTKMAVTAFGVAPASPEQPTFSDVPSDNLYYQYVEGAYAAGLMMGVGGGLFDLTSPITREQAIAVVARKMAADHDYSLATMSGDEISAILAGFGDAASVSPSLRDEMAFAVKQGLVKGSAAGDLAPKTPMRRIAAAALLIRAMRGGSFVLDANDDGTTITVEVGDTIKVVLAGNPTTGYAWTVDLSTEDAALLEQVGEPVYVPDSDLVGAGGTYTYTFKALAVGEAELKLSYARPWESVPPLETFSVTVKIEEASVDGAAGLLDGTSWALEAWSDSSLDPTDFEITANFADGRISGKAAVNLYSGPYTADSTGAFSVGLLMQTLMAGSGPAMAAETVYLGLLQEAGKYVLDGDELTLLDDEDDELLIFRATAGA